MYKLKDIMMFFGLSERTIRRHLNQGILTGTKVKGTWYFTEDDIQKYMGNDVSLKHIKKAHNIEVMNFINGFNQAGKSTCIMFDLKEVSKDKMKDLSEFMSKLKNPFDFKALMANSKIRVVFIGDFKDSQKVMEFIEENDYEVYS